MTASDRAAELRGIPRELIFADGKSWGEKTCGNIKNRSLHSSNTVGSEISIFCLDISFDLSI